jgi:heme-degrading monooxygenase HmoA
MAVTLINVFSVLQGKEDEFVKWWQDVKADIIKQSGFISGKFYKSMKPESTFNFINVAIWENDEVYWKAYEKSVPSMESKLAQLGVEMVPALTPCLPTTKVTRTTPTRPMTATWPAGRLSA